MSAVVSVKVPESVKKLMKKYSDRVNWSERIREFIISELKRLEAEEGLRRAMELIEKTKGVEEGFAVREIRNARDSN